MRKRLTSILLALCMALTLPPCTAAAFEQPPDTDYWAGLSRTQVVDTLRRIAGKTETRDVVLVCYPSDGAANIATAITQQFAPHANRERCKIYYYAFSGGSGDPSRIDGELTGLLGKAPEAWPVAVTYNTTTKNALSRENVSNLTSMDEINGLRDLMLENGVSSGSSGADPEPDPDPSPNPDPDPDPGPGPELPDPPAPALPGGMDEMGWEVLRLANQHRMSIGREPLSVFGAIQDTASLRAREIYDDYRPDHTRPDGRICWTAYQECGVLYHYSAENIASGQSTAASVMNSWLHSPGHRRNLESARAVHIGIGHYYGSAPSAGRHNWTQDFASADNCRFSALELSAPAISGRRGADLESLLADADLAVTAVCYRHGDCILPLIAAMCSGYDANTAEDQTIMVSYGGQTARLTIAARHNWDNGQITRAPSCTEVGERTYTCTDPGCGRTRTVMEPSAGHSLANGSSCGGCGMDLGTIVGDAMGTNLAEAGLTEQEACDYAARLAESCLGELGFSGVPTVTPVAYAPPVDETADAPGACGYLDYTVSVSPMGGRFMAAAETAGNVTPVLRLDIPPMSWEAGPGNVHENACIITFDAAGGTVSPAAMSAGPDGTLSSLPVPSRSGCIFNGWFTLPAGGTPVTVSDVFSRDTTIWAQWTCGSSGGSLPAPDFGGNSVPVRYQVSVPSAEGGRVTVSPSSAAPGTRVTVAAVPDPGCELAGLTVTAGNGEALALTEQGEGQYVFTMPSGGVSVSASFRPIAPAEPEEALWRNPYTDVAGGAWYCDAVRFVDEHGLMDGYGKSLFGPNDNLTRAQFAQILFNKEGGPVVNYLLRFGDITAGAWYTEAVRWAASQGIAGGYGNGLFGPDDSITREQFVVMLWRCAGCPAAADKELYFTDADKISGYALEALRWAVACGIVNGYEGRLDPRGLVARVQAAQMLKNYLDQQETV